MAKNIYSSTYDRIEKRTFSEHYLLFYLFI